MILVPIKFYRTPKRNRRMIKQDQHNNHLQVEQVDIVSRMYSTNSKDSRAARVVKEDSDSMTF